MSAATTKSNTAVSDRFKPRALYETYRVKIAIRDKIHGGKPKNEDLLGEHIRRKTGHNDEITNKQIDDANKKLPSLEGLEEIEKQEVEKSSNGFLSDERGLYVNAYQLKAMFRQSASMLGIYKEKRGSKNMCAEGAEIKGLVVEDKLYLGKEAPDGIDEGIVHAMTPKGPISGLKKVDFVLRPVLEFEIWVLKVHPNETRHIGEDDIVKILTFSQENGLGADRSQGSGKFDVVEFQKL